MRLFFIVFWILVSQVTWASDTENNEAIRLDGDLAIAPDFVEEHNGIKAELGSGPVACILRFKGGAVPFLLSGNPSISIISVQAVYDGKIHKNAKLLVSSGPYKGQYVPLKSMSGLYTSPFDFDYFWGAKLLLVEDGHYAELPVISPKTFETTISAYKDCVGSLVK
ncbi:hypothetical protein [Marinomonas sp. FW-1]|uniref:hypothetical protein n=1 Tax=Marinomonas sp. FW-1 TaxID=2071621 RepID=UPI0010BF9D60|nr:hypothetical protein [Marinomonas sp. FW-1]